MNNRNRKKYLPILFIFLLILLGGLFVRSRRNGNAEENKNKNEVSTQVNQTFEFVGRDQNGNPTDASLQFSLTNAAKKESVTIQGKNATTKDGKVFLVLDIAVKNDSSQALYLLPVDLIRLVIDEQTKVAPSVHQGLLEVRPISAKLSNLGFVVEGSQKEFKFEVGEVDGEKQEMVVRF